MLPLYILFLAAKISLAVVPSVCFEPCDVEIRATLERHPHNRLLILDAVNRNDGSARSSYIPLSGTLASTRITVNYRELTAGEYDLVAILLRGGESFRAEGYFIVKGAWEEDGNYAKRGVSTACRVSCHETNE